MIFKFNLCVNLKTALKKGLNKFFFNGNSVKKKCYFWTKNPLDELNSSVKWTEDSEFQDRSTKSVQSEKQKKTEEKNEQSFQDL